MVVMVNGKNFNNNNSGKFGAKTKQHQIHPRIAVIKIFTLNLPSQPFLGCHLVFYIFFHHSLFEGRTLFYNLAVLD